MLPEANTVERLMLDAAYEPTLLINDKLEILGLNLSAHTFLGGRDVVGAVLTDLLDSADISGMFQYVIENQETEFEVQTKIESRFYRVRTRLNTTDADRILIGVAFQDVTELVRLNRARRDMVANISHELRTPIANIRLIIDSLFHEADKPKRKKSIQSLRAIARETDALLWLVQELLDLSMIESGQAIVRMVDVPMQEVIDEAVERLREQAENREVTLAADVPEDVSALCDRDLSRRVVVNLIHNAIKYSPEGSTVTVKAATENDYIMITVADEGEGVPADQTERIFERFYQVDSSRSKSEGTGLGLSICKHIVEAHGGKIWAVPAEEAGGGCFSFTLLNADYTHEGD